MLKQSPREKPSVMSQRAPNNTSPWPPSSESTSRQHEVLQEAKTKIHLLAFGESCEHRVKFAVFHETYKV